MKNNHKRINKNLLLFVIPIIIMTLALGMLSYPLLSNYLAISRCSEARAEYYDAVDNLDNEAIKKAIEAAQSYNLSLKSLHFQNETLQAESSYNELLNVNGNGIMGYVEIPKINVNLPIYHGTGKISLDNGVGHLVGSSLPTGCIGTHTVLTGHSGVVGNRLFSDLEQMVEGDIFYLDILNNKFAYAVTEIHIVEPYDVSYLSIEDNKDRCTLVTCTPYGINSHRLLVQGDRIDLDKAEQYEGTYNYVSSSWAKEYYLGFLFGTSILLFIILIYSIIKRIRRKKA